MKFLLFPTALACGLLFSVNCQAIDADKKAAAHEKAVHETTTHEADNTGKNVRDKDGATLTAFDQGASEADRNITANIRKAVVDDDSLSMSAHNIKIITNGGLVTLRGPVKSAAEKANIEAKAKKVAGVTRVDSQLEVDHD
jgi:osmotically-inducible protein OsmY